MNDPLEKLIEALDADDSLTDAERREIYFSFLCDSDYERGREEYENR